MKRLRDLAFAAGDAALQLTLPWFDAGLGSAVAPRGAVEPQADRPNARRPAPDSLPAGRGRRQACLRGQTVPYELRRSPRRTIGFFVDDTGLRVTAPRWVTLAEIDAALSDKQDWILRKLHEWRSHAKRREASAIRWQDGDELAYLGERIALRLDTGTSGVELAGSELRIGIAHNAPPDRIRSLVHAWLQARARELFAQRLPIYSARLGRAPKRWQLSSARTRWGSCTADGSIRLNWRLVHCPLPLVDYVIAHELAHLDEMNHGPRFWATVYRLMPEFETARQQLKAYPDGLKMS